jgi:hypothetical protein
VIVIFIIVVALGTIGSAVINYLLVGRSRSRWHTIALGGVIVGAAFALLLNFRSLWRGDNLQKELGALQRQQEYSNVARYNAFGLLGLANPPLVEHQPLNNILGSYLRGQNNLSWDCTPEALNAYTEAIKLESKFPFAYYYRASCEKADNTGDWQLDLDTARTIFGITTQIPGHNVNHDEVLKWIEAGYLGKR